jgi:hypothetical protein
VQEENQKACSLKMRTGNSKLYVIARPGLNRLVRRAARIETNCKNCLMFVNV